MKRVRVLLLATALAVMLQPANAAEAEAVGWWWRAQTGLVVDVPPPPTAPAGGMVVSAGPDGPTAVGAVRFLLGSGEQARLLRLDVEGTLGTPTLLACPSAVQWAPVEAGRWEARPALACDLAQSPGVANEDGTAWSFDVSAFAVDGVLDVVVLPDAPEGEVRPDAFEVRFAPLADDALSLAPPDPVSGPNATESGPPDTPTEFRPVPPPPPGRAVVPPAPTSGTPQPEVPAVAGPEMPEPSEADSPEESDVASGGTDEDDEGTAAAAAAALLVATAGFLWSFRPRAAAEPTERGLSRWRAPRKGPPPPIT